MIRAALILIFMAQSVAALDITLPSRSLELGRYWSERADVRLAVGPALDAQVPMQDVQGQVLRQSWRLDGEGLALTQIAQPAINAALEQGFEEVFSCTAAQCGGFDFRFALEGFYAPKMFVDLRNFSYTITRKQAANHQEYVAVLASRSPSAGFLEVTHVSTSTSGASLNTSMVIERSGGGQAARETAGGRLGAMLNQDGRAVLDDVTFASGSAELSQERAQTLANLASYIKAHPDRNVMLVGHTDTQGNTQANLVLSQQRAQAVRKRLIDVYDVPASQIVADGIGYLAPRATNFTELGRRLNRRVEAVIIPRD